MEHVLSPLDAKERSEEFDALPLKQQRVILAQEVVLLVESKRIKPAFQVYIRPLYDTCGGVCELQDVLIDKAKTPFCKACILGALTCSLAYIKGGITYRNLDAETIQVILAPYFTQEELGIIECAFEGMPMQSGAGYIYFKSDKYLTDHDKEYKHRLYKTMQWNSYLRTQTTSTEENYAEYILLKVANKIIENEGKVQF